MARARRGTIWRAAKAESRKEELTHEQINERGRSFSRALNSLIKDKPENPAIFKEILKDFNYRKFHEETGFILEPEGIAKRFFSEDWKTEEVRKVLDALGFERKQINKIFFSFLNPEERLRGFFSVRGEKAIEKANNFSTIEGKSKKDLHFLAVETRREISRLVEKEIAIYRGGDLQKTIDLLNELNENGKRFMREEFDEKHLASLLTGFKREEIDLILRKFGYAESQIQIALDSLENRKRRR